MKPGGHIVIQGSLGEHCYTVGSSMFPAMTADKGDLISDGIFTLVHSSNNYSLALDLSYSLSELDIFPSFEISWNLKLDFLRSTAGRNI